MEIDGVDLSRLMLLYARAALTRACGTIRLHCGDAGALPFANDTFPLVMSAHMLEHLSDPYAGIREMARVLRPGGILLLIATRPGVSDAFLRLKWRHARIAHEQCLRWMSAAGLTNLRHHCLGAHYGIPDATSIAFSGRKDAGMNP